MPSEYTPSVEERRQGAKAIEQALHQCGIRVQYLMAGPSELFDVASVLLKSDFMAAHDEQVRAAAQIVTSATSDGYHTFAELYDYRMLYNAHAAQGWLASGIPVVKSWRHSDGALSFGGGWFIVVAELPTGQVANHYKAEHWDIFDVPVVEIPPEYDGHTPAVAAERLRESLRAVPAGQKEDNQK